MAAISTIKVANAISTDILKTSSATVGVDKTYDPEGFIFPGVARWVDRSGGIALGYPSVTLSVRPPNKASRIYRITLKLTIPTLEQTSASTATGIQPAPTKAYDCAFIGEWLLPERSTEAERKALFNQLKSLFFGTINASDDAPTDVTGTPLYAAVVNYDQPY